MRHRIGWLAAVAALGSAACGAGGGPGARTAHLERVPAGAGMVLQADLERVLDRAQTAAWAAEMEAVSRGRMTFGCAVDLLGRITLVTAAGEPGFDGRPDEDPLIVVSGDLDAARVVPCVVRMFPEAFGDTPPAVVNGRVELLGAGGEALVAADLPDGSLALGVAEDVDAALGRTAGDSAAAAPALAALAALVPPGDLNAYLLRPVPLPDGMRLERAAVSLQRGTLDRYEIYLEAADAATAEFLSDFALPALAAYLAFGRMQLASDASQVETDPEGARFAASALPLIDAVLEALDRAQFDVQGREARLVLEIDPTIASPTALLTGGASAFWLMRGPTMAVPEPMYQAPDTAP